MRYEDDYDELEYSGQKGSRTKSSSGKSRSSKSSASSSRNAGSSRTASRSTDPSRNTGASRKAGASRTADSSKKSGSAKKRSAQYDSYSEAELKTAERKRQKRAAQQKKAKKKRRRLIAIVAVEAILLTVILAFIWVISKYDTIQKPNWGKMDILKNTEIAEEVVQEMKTGYTDIMVFGVDEGGELDGGSGADVNILVHINNATGEIQLVSFYRDLYLNTGGSTFHKLTDIYRSDGAQGALGAMNMNMDLHLEQFVTVNWATVAEVINLLGGIDIDVPEVMMSQINGYITATVQKTGIGSTQLTHSGYQHLDGIQAVAFCRIRKINVPGYSIGDYGRTERQREVIGLLMQKVKECDPNRLLDIIDLILPNTFTNIELKDILGMAANVLSYDIVDTKGFPFNQTGSDIASSIVNSLDMVTDIKDLHTYLYGDSDGYEVSSYARDIVSKLYSIPGVIHN